MFSNSFHAAPDKMKLFKDILDFATAENVPKLKELINAGFCIDFRINYDDVMHTPLSFLAYKKNHKAVDFLLGYMVNPNSAIRGYAMTDDSDFLIEKLLRQGASLDAVIEGCITANKIDKAQLFLSRKRIAVYFAERDNNINNDTDELALHDKIAQNKMTEKHVFQCAMIEVFAIQGEKDKVNQYIDSTLNKEHKTNLIFHALKGYGIGNHVNNANELSLMDKNNENSCYDYVEEGYVIGGHWENLRLPTLYNSRLLFSCAKAGYVALAEKLYPILEKLPRTDDKIDKWLMRGATLFFDIFLEKYIHQCKLQEALFKGYKNGGFFANEKIALQLLSFCSDRYRSILINQAKNSGFKLTYDINLLVSKLSALPTSDVEDQSKQDEESKSRIGYVIKRSHK